MDRRAVIVARHFATEQRAIEQLATQLQEVTTRLTEMEATHAGAGRVFADLDKVTGTNVAARIREITGDRDARADVALLSRWLELNGRQVDLTKRLNEAKAALDTQVDAHRIRDQEAHDG